MSPLYEMVVEILASKHEIDRGEVRPDTTFRELEFDSLSMVDFAQELQKRLGIQIAEEEVFDCSTVGGVVKVLERLSAKT